MRLFVAAIVAVLALTVAARHVGSVPGCPDLDVLEAEVDTSADFLNNLLLCFCKVQDKGKVDISCLYGSSLEHLDKATEAVKRANLTTNKISFQHIEFAASGLPSFAQLAPALTTLEIRECTNFEPVIVPENAFDGLETTLKNLTIDSCSLKEIPAAITDLNQLETLVLSNNKIEHIHAPRLSNKKELSYLDLSGNFITTVDAGSFEPLQKLETLIFGERNYINDSVVEAIVTLKSLKTLDLSRADGIFEPPTEIFDALPQLEVLKLSGCSVSTLEPGAFAALKNLKEMPPTGLRNLQSLYLSECPLVSLGPDLLKDYPALETLDVAKCNLTQLEPETFVNQRHSLKTLHLQRNLLKAIDPEIIGELKSLEQLDISGNPFLCDSEIAKLIFAIEDRYKVAAKEGKEFLLANANDTLCDRPYTLRRQPLLDVDSDELQPYDEKLDTTTPLMTTTVASMTTTPEDTTTFIIPDLFVGAKTNDTLFKEEPRREVYDLNKANDPKGAMEQQEGNKTFAVTVTVVVIAIISIIAIIAVMLFMRKKRKIANAEALHSRKKPSKLDDGMVEIELDSNGPTKKL
ncbi:leucine Rich repeat-containing domain protein [Teladorsagia circumcincta]|uniref:Leucine Rich repeat-containing domain protein n=1 Tax=Teladorsagia circumcincta TaxID=45464 RepID=A0A2G9UM87_TELCI|nr:leucine Rich repeat-containing domain protein [Teladorsagia circumcincta]